ncbi:hypothetical protein ZTR_04332 [Talaromyces verruculosus]|nr:hypothetical protein ZTR_04332 [Talaromyces verruculosus]
METINHAKSILTFAIRNPLSFVYLVIQQILNWIFAPTPPPPSEKLRRPRIAVIGAGLTGVSSAAHCVGHGFDVKIFEARSKEKGLGGIWSRVNSTSALQIHSIMFRFHPSVKWDTAYPTQENIKEQIASVWKLYGLDKKTVFDTPITSVKKNSSGRWIINDNEAQYGTFDGIVAAVGSCGDPQMPHLPDHEKFSGPTFHSSELDGKDVKGKKVLIIGGGASAVEALEFAVSNDAAEIDVLSRSDKWIIPRNVFVDVLLSLNIFGGETSFSWIPEWFLRKFFYRDLQDISPSKKGLYTDTPMVNSELFEQIRAGKARWLRGDILACKEEGILFNHRAQGVPKGGPGHESVVNGDVIIMATGYKRPSLSFLPDNVFEKKYEPPNWYLQVFPPQDPTICATNSTYLNAIGTVGNYHIGIYTRFLLMFLVDPLTRPREGLMKLWIDFTRVVKRFAPTGAFDFFTYAELIYWYCFVSIINPFRWKWVPFIFFGLFQGLPLAIVEEEDRLRQNGKAK